MAYEFGILVPPLHDTDREQAQSYRTISNGLEREHRKVVVFLLNQALFHRTRVSFYCAEIDNERSHRKSLLLLCSSSSYITENTHSIIDY